GGGAMTFPCTGTMPTIMTISNFDDAVTAANVVATFTMGANAGASGGVFSPYFDTMSTIATTLSTGTNKNIGTMATLGATGAYAGFGIYYNTCVDAHSFTGVKFTLGGNLGTCMLTFQLQLNSDAAPSNMKGLCTAGGQGSA